MPDPTVAEIMRTEVPVVAPDATVATVARLMAEHQLPGIPVVRDGEIIGIITESDLIARQADVDVPEVFPFLDAMLVADGGRDFNEELRHVLATTAEQLMTSPVFNIRSSASLEQIATLMLNERVNPVPVIDEQLSLVGIISRADLVRVIARLENADSSTSAVPPGSEWP